MLNESMSTMELDGMPAPTQQQSDVLREAPEVAPEVKAFTSAWSARILEAKKFHDKSFKRMRDDMDWARMGADGEWIATGNYTANIIQRHVSQKVASLYAKNPRALAKPRRQLRYKLWDERQETLVLAMQGATLGDPMAMQLVQEVQAVDQQMQMLRKLGKTLELLFHYYIDEQEPRFKIQMKQAVRRACVCGVAYVKLGFQRLLEPRPGVSEQINDVSVRLSRMRQIMADVADGVIDEEHPELVELQAMLADLQNKEFLIAREGPVWTFPRSTQIIPDPRCRQLVGFVGAGWVAEEMLLTNDEIKAAYKVDIGKMQIPYQDRRTSKVEQFYESDMARGRDHGKQGAMTCVWEVWNKTSGQSFTIADGYPGFLRAPTTPDVNLERFWPYFPLTFNDGEHEDEVFPISDVSLMRPMQEEYNRSRQGLREHRRANRPKYAVARGRLEEEDIDQLKSHPNSAVLQLVALQPGQRLDELIQPFKPAPIDPALYDTTQVFDDTLRTVGTQEAQLGGLAGATATESSIAEGARISTQSSGVDDLDEMLTDISRSSGQLMLMELSPETVSEIVGVGAVWPMVSREQVAKEISLEVKAGSSGRPNKAAELANLERAAPTILQIPGVSPEWFARQVLERLDDGIDLDEAIVRGMPSMVAMNAATKAAQPATGDPETDPAQQGGNGDAPPRADRNEQGGQPAFPV